MIIKSTILFLALIFLSYKSFAGVIYISNEGSDNITVIDLNTLTIIDTIEGGDRPRDMHYLKEQGHLLVAASEDDIITAFI